MTQKAKAAAELTRIALVVVGTAMIGVGAYTVTPAAGFIVPGTIMLVLGIVGTLRSKG